MAGGDEIHLDSVGNRHGPLVADRLEQRHGTEGIGLAVERQRRRVPGEAMAVRVGRVLFLDASGIRQHDAAQILRAGGAEHPPGKTLHDNARQVADVIEVRMRQHDRVERRGRDRQVPPVQLAQLLEPLEQPRIEEHPGLAGIEQILRAGDGAGSAEESKGEWHRQSEILTR